MKNFNWYGISASIIYISAVIIGGILWQGYDHLKQPISELIMTDAPNQIIMQPLFWLYNILLAIFSLKFYQWGANKFLKTSAIALLICALTGIGMNFFAQDPINSELTFTGTMHLVLAGIAAFATLVALFTAFIGFIKMPEYKFQKNISLLFGLLILISGPITASATTNFPHLFGLSERITIGSFILWLLIISYSLLRKDLKK